MMLYFFFLWVALNLITLLVIRFRIDSYECYNAIRNSIVDNYFTVMIYNIFIAFIILPLSLPDHIEEILKNK